MTTEEPRTSCEEYGHDYDTDPENISYHECSDCGHSYTD